MDPKQLKQELDTLTILQSMIQLAAERLDGLRTQCTITAEITQQEIRTLETKLIKLFSKQLLVKKNIPKEQLPNEFIHLPSLKLWLHIVGLNERLITGLLEKFSSNSNLEELLIKTVDELECWLLLLIDNGDNNSCINNGSEEIRRLTRAVGNLKRYSGEFTIQIRPCVL